MALDGIVVSNIVHEMNQALSGGRLSKIAQPENDELILTIKNQKDTYRLLLSASASLPLVYFTELNKENPMTAPNFCMLLRKHAGNGKIISISQPGLERIIDICLEHLDEMGDLCQKHLIIELMGKHSNIILTNESDTIVDSIKHVPLSMSSIREVLPGRPYFIPDTMHKKDPLTLTQDEVKVIFTGRVNAAKAVYSSLTGISPQVAEELLYRSDVDSTKAAEDLSEAERNRFYQQLRKLMDEITSGIFHPAIYMKNGEPQEFSSVSMSMYSGYECQETDSASQMLESYYAVRNTVARIRQKSMDLRKIVQTCMDRSHKKYDLQKKQLKDTEKRDRYRIYGELLNTYGYEAQPGARVLETVNYYTGEPIAIPLDPELTAHENAKRYFEKYNKQKRTFEALTEQLKDTQEEMEHLDSISTAIDLACTVDDLNQVRREMAEYGYIKKHLVSPKEARKNGVSKSKPYHYISSDGFDIYVGHNNYQNEELTFKFAEGNDIWMHAKKIPGSHVIIKSKGGEIPDRTYEEAGQLAAYYSKARDAEKVEIDYIEKKHVKKPNKGKPGFVIYHTNYSLVASPDISKIRQLS